jgi:hypothetical protein
MARYRAICWLGSEGGEQVLEVNSSSYSGAEKQFRRVYGAESISNLVEVGSLEDGVSGGGSSLSDIGDMGGWFVLGCIVFATWLMMEFWWIIVPIGAICALGWIADKTRHWWDK